MAPTSQPVRLAPGSRHRLPVRNPRLDFDAGIPRYWLAGNAAATHLVNGLNLVFPDGERFFIKAVLDHLPQIEDPALRRQVRGFFGQEGRHAREHERYFDVLEAQGYRVLDFARRFRTFGSAMLRLPAGLRLAMTAGAEHSTAIFGTLALEDEMLAREAHPTMRRLVVWHAVEEIEHKAVAFDVLQATHPSRALRILGFALVMAILFGWTMVGNRMLIRQDLRAGRLTRSELREMRRAIRPRRVEMWRHFLVRVRDYMRRDFHPNQVDDLALAKSRLRDVGLAPAL